MTNHPNRSLTTKAVAKAEFSVDDALGARLGFMAGFVTAATVGGETVVSATCGKPDEWDSLRQAANDAGLVFFGQQSNDRVSRIHRPSPPLSAEERRWYESHM